MKYAAKRAVALVEHAAAAMRIVKAPLWLVTIACMRDTTGREIERHLKPMRGEFQIAAFNVCLALGADGQYHRTWASPRARRLATLLIFFAYLCQRSRFHGVVVWMIRGIPKGALAVATRLRSVRFGKEVVSSPSHLNTVYSCVAELEDSGLLIAQQFAASKCPSWCVGKPKPDPRRPGKTMQWAFNYYFLTVCPYVDGLEGRIVPAPRGDPLPSPAELEQRNAAAAEHWTRKTSVPGTPERHTVHGADSGTQTHRPSMLGHDSTGDTLEQSTTGQWDADAPVFYAGELELKLGGDQEHDQEPDNYADQARRAYARYVELSSRAPPDDKTN